MEAVNAHLTDSTALNMPVPTILIPAKKKPIKYNFRPHHTLRFGIVIFKNQHFTRFDITNKFCANQIKST